ncbi:MAG TPA: hypothetical protein PKD81_18525 [Thiolinea sp.]|jgi:hypothetical protein|nr:hypothetical protein [Thiolinea sp.]
MKTNIFLNGYKKREDELTYAFFSMLEFINEKAIFEFLSKEELSYNPLHGIKLLPVGDSTNPDGKLILENKNNEKFNLFFENKTKIRNLSKDQLLGHLELCEGNDKLLVITPRKSDSILIAEINSSRIIFYTWQEIATFLNKSFSKEKIIQQFVDYGERTGHFEELSEITIDDARIHWQALAYKFDIRMNSILNYIKDDFDFGNYGITINKKDMRINNDWGRHGMEIGYNDRDNKTWGQWIFVGYYYDTVDHSLAFKKKEAEIVIFFDVDPDQKKSLLEDKEFAEKIELLSQHGFESNLDGTLTNNLWRLFFIRKSLTDFAVINAFEIEKFISDAFNSIRAIGLINHPYFKEFNIQ